MEPTPRPVVEDPGLVSAVIPVYNRVDQLPASIQSVLDQTYESVEVVVVDDGSTDDVAAVVARFDDRVRYVRQDNQGAAAARNTGMEEARGEFIAMLDSDDRWLPWKTALQVNLLVRRPDLLLAWTDYAAVNRAGQLTHPRYLREMYGAYGRFSLDDMLDHVGPASAFFPELPEDLAACPVLAGDLFDGMVLGNCIHTSTVMVRRTAARSVGGYKAELRTTGEDYDFHIRICEAGPVGFLDVPSTLYQVGDAGQATAPHMIRAYAIHNLETVLYLTENKGDRITLPRRTLRHHLGFSYRWAGTAQFRAGETHEGRRWLRRALGYHPTSLAAWGMFLVSLLPFGVFQLAIRLKRLVRPLSR